MNSGDLRIGAGKWGKSMRGKKHPHSRMEEPGRRRWHHEPEHGPAGHGQHHGGHPGHGGHRGHGPGGRGHGRHGLQSGRKLSAPDLQIILMALLANTPSHGYELI